MVTTRGVFDSCPSAPLIELRLELFIHPFLKLVRPEISENLGFSRRPRWSGQRRTAARMLIVGRLCEAAIDWRLTQTPYKLFFEMEVWLRSKIKRARD